MDVAILVEVNNYPVTRSLFYLTSGEISNSRNLKVFIKFLDTAGLLVLGRIGQVVR